MGELVELATEHFKRPAPRLIAPRFTIVCFIPLLVRASPDQRYRRALARSEVFFPYFAMAVVYDDRRSRVALRAAGIRPPPLRHYFDRLVEFALAAEWGRRPISRITAARRTAPSSMRVARTKRTSSSSIGGEPMTSTRLSALDASFLSVETPTAHMHVGWVAVFSAPAEGRLPRFSQLRDHIELRMARAPRYRQKLASVPLGLHAPEWVDDADFSIDRHVYWAPGPLHDLVDEVMSMPLRRDRPLWEIWICEDIGDQQMALVGKMHHCMVDGLAAVELSSLLLDLTPEPAPCASDGWSTVREPNGVRLLFGAVRDRMEEQLGLLRWPLRAVDVSVRVPRAELTSAVPCVARALAHSLRPAPESLLNTPLSPLRRLAWSQRPLDDLREIKRAYGTSVNDVLLAAVAGGVREFVAGQGRPAGDAQGDGPRQLA